MKKYEGYNEFNQTYSDYYVGETADVKAMYKSICRNSRTMSPTFCRFPKFSENMSMYALCIDGYGYMTVINSDTMLSMIIDGTVREV